MAKTKSKSVILGYWKILIYVLVISILFGPLLAIPSGIPNVPIYLTDVITLLMCGGWLFYVSKLKKAVRFNKLVQAFILFFCVAFFSVLLTPIQMTSLEKVISLFYLVRFASYASIAGVLLILIQNKKINPHSIIQLMTATGITASVAGWLQYILYDDLRNLYYLGWDPHYKRIYSFYFDPNYFGLIVVLTFLLILFRFKRHFGYILGAFFLFLTIAFTYSRSSYVSLILSSVTLSIMKRKFIITFSIVLLLLFSIVLLPRPSGEGVRLERVISIYERIDSYKLAIQMFKDHPLLGVGFNTVRYAKRVYGAAWENVADSHSGAGFDSSLLFVLATTGITGMVLFMYLLYYVYCSGNRLFKVSFVAILVHSFFLNSLFYPWVLAWLSVLFGLGSDEKKLKVGS